MARAMFLNPAAIPSAMNIRVNQVSPSGVDTEMFHKAVPPGVSADLQPEQVAEKILYFASNESSPRTGENFMMSGNS